CTFHFSLTRRQPSSTLFPYTTLFRYHRLRSRSGADDAFGHARGVAGSRVGVHADPVQPQARTVGGGRNGPRARNDRWLQRQPDRSEEHTSELQSLAYLVCRLLLEKKK